MMTMMNCKTVIPPHHGLYRFTGSGVIIDVLSYYKSLHIWVVDFSFNDLDLIIPYVFPHMQKLAARLPKTREVREASYSCLCPPGMFPILWPCLKNQYALKFLNYWFFSLNWPCFWWCGGFLPSNFYTWQPVQGYWGIGVYWHITSCPVQQIDYIDMAFGQQIFIQLVQLKNKTKQKHHSMCIHKIHMNMWVWLKQYLLQYQR